jgi:hypothetical protein
MTKETAGGGFKYRQKLTVFLENWENLRKLVGWIKTSNI